MSAKPENSLSTRLIILMPKKINETSELLGVTSILKYYFILFIKTYKKNGWEQNSLGLNATERMQFKREGCYKTFNLWNR